MCRGLEGFLGKRLIAMAVTDGAQWRGCLDTPPPSILSVELNELRNKVDYLSVVGFRNGSGNRNESGIVCTAMDTIPSSSIRDPAIAFVPHVSMRIGMMA